jgi:hypothetical protein
MNDLRFALRQLRKAPGFTVTALATVAICLGANLAIFAVIDSILLRPLPFSRSDRLVTIFNTYPKAGVERDGSSLTNYYERRGNIPAFSSLSIFRYSTALRLVAIGTLVGLILAMFSTRALSALLYNVGAFDLATFATVALVLCAVALLASYIPALRATHADPMVTLGHNG